MEYICGNMEYIDNMEYIWNLYIYIYIKRMCKAKFTCLVSKIEPISQTLFEKNTQSLVLR